MFDDSFRMTARYFSILQLLRIIPTWIENSSRDIDSLCDKGEGERDVVIENMKRLQLQKDRLVHKLNTRIQQKVNEVENLKNGVSDDHLSRRLTCTPASALTAENYTDFQRDVAEGSVHEQSHEFISLHLHRYDNLLPPFKFCYRMFFNSPTLFYPGPP